MYLTYIVLLALFDLPWLTFISPSYAKVITSIQNGSAPEYRMAGAIPVYLGLAYLLMYAKTAEQAFMIGAASYAVYDFTVYALMKKYPLWLALADTLWGGILFGLVFTVYKRYVQE